jgi:hypothetical protein
MNSHGISHRLFVAALTPEGKVAGKRPSAARSAAPHNPVKIRPTKLSQPFSVLAAQRLNEWSWSGWQHTTI